MSDSECLAACGRLTPHLSEWAQFKWGFFGGSLIVFFIGLSFSVQRLKKEKFFPLATGEVVVIVFTLAAPLLTGFSAQMIEAHTPLLAAFDGAGAATIFFFVTAHILHMQKPSPHSPP